jgi:hypothetical protein
LPVDVLHHVEERDLVLPTQIVDGHNAGVAQAGEQASLAFEASFEFSRGEGRVDHLHGHVAFQTRVGRQIHDTHAATAQRAEDVISIAEHRWNSQRFLQSVELQAGQ